MQIALLPARSLQSANPSKSRIYEFKSPGDLSPLNGDPGSLCSSYVAASNAFSGTGCVNAAKKFLPRRPVYELSVREPR